MNDKIIKNHYFLLYSYILNHFLLIPTGWNQQEPVAGTWEREPGVGEYKLCDLLVIEPQTILTIFVTETSSLI